MNLLSQFVNQYVTIESESEELEGRLISFESGSVVRKSGTVKYRMPILILKVGKQSVMVKSRDIIKTKGRLHRNQ